jgi:hypothetical protein
VFFKVIMPLILPGLISGALFAFVTSFDEVVVVLFIASPEQRTLPKQMFSGIREMISPTITAAATLLIIFATLMLTTVELLRGAPSGCAASGTGCEPFSVAVTNPAPAARIAADRRRPENWHVQGQQPDPQRGSCAWPPRLLAKAGALRRSGSRRAPLRRPRRRTVLIC